MSLNVELLIIFLLIFANAMFVMSELAIVSARKVRLQQLANQGNTRAKAAFDLASSPTEFLGTVQVDRKSTRLNSSHRCISYAVFCLKKKK